MPRKKQRLWENDEPLKPYAWQQADIDKCVSTMSAQVGGLVASSPGAGKTLVASEVAKRLGAKVILIIAPQATHERAWHRTLVRQGVIPYDNFHTLIGTKPGRAAFESLAWKVPGVYITTPQWFARQSWKHIKPDMVIFDEVHMAGSYGIRTQKALHQLSDAPYRMGLSGTMLRNSFENAWSIARWIEPSKMTLDYWVWRVSKCKTKYSAFAPQQREVIGELNPGELFGSLTCYIQHLQREYCCQYHPHGFLAHLPAPLRLEIQLDMHPAQARFYREMEGILASQLLDENGGTIKVHAEQFIVARNMLRRCALGLPNARQVIERDKDGNLVEKTKLYFEPDAISPALDTLIEDLPTYEGKHTLVLTHSKQFANVAVDRIGKAGYTVDGWHGDASKPQRERTLNAFTSGELEVIVGVIAAMGTGTDGLQEVCYNLSWLSYDDDASNNQQAIGRLDRLGQRWQVVERDYQMLKTIDVGFYSKQFQKVLELEASLKGTS